MKRLITFGLVALTLLLALSVGREITQLISVRQRIAASEQKLADLKKAQEDLSKEKERRQTESFIEEQARNKLGLARPGEEIIILPKEDKQKETSNKQKENLPNWQKWLNLFLKS